jgi:formamidopyrimidine-DNA glycosylase
VSCKAATPTGAQTLTTFVKEIWELLFEYSTAEDEGTRSVVAECIGKIVLVDAEKHLPELVSHLQVNCPFSVHCARAHTHTHTHARARTHTHTHTHTRTRTLDHHCSHIFLPPL